MDRGWCVNKNSDPITDFDNQSTNRSTRVLFITQSSAYPQLGVLYLVDALRQAGIESLVVSCDLPAENLDSILTDYRPAVVGMSVLTAPQVVDFKRHSIRIKNEYPEISIVWGGVHPTILSEECMDSSYIDFVFIGQGEDVFPDLVLDIVNGTNKFTKRVQGRSPQTLDRYSPAWDKVSLSQYLFSERHSVRSPITKVQTSAAKVFDQIKSDIQAIDPGLSSDVSIHVLEDIKKWDVGLYELDKSIFYYLITSRGCPYSCTFCSEPLQIMHGNAAGKFTWNSHDLDWVKCQIDVIRERLARDGEDLDGVGIWDDMFWVDKKRARNILSYLASEGLTYLIEARADQLIRDDYSLYNFLGETNCSQVFIGAESASQETLDYIKKHTDIEDYYRLMKHASIVKVPLRMSFIVGFPGETDESVNKTLDFCEAVTNGAYGPWVNISGPKIFTPYPGTVEYDRAVEAGFVKPATHVDWRKIHRSTEAYLECFPWMRNYPSATLERLEHYFGQGYSALTTH